MNYQHILFVDDEEEQRDFFKSAVDDWNKSNAARGRAFGYKFGETVEEARDLLKRVRFDGALFDLRVRRKNGAGRAEPAGNELAMIALKEHGIPIAIMSADATVLDPTLKSIETISVFDKNAARNHIGNGYDQSIDWFARQWEMMEVLGNSRRVMERSAADIFLQRLWPRWKILADLAGTDRDELIKIVTRQYVSHVADYLGLDNPDNASWHPFENYVSPALMSDRAHTGDIFEIEGELFVVLTPQCDMATKKVKNVIVAKCVPGIDKWHDTVRALRAADSNNKRKDPTKFLQSFVNQNIEASKHFLPPLPGRDEPLLVHFSSVDAMPLVDLNERLESRIASISSPFLANIVQRFGAYISRTGQPNIDVNRL
jgi:CheY-like chemotaxis protein